MCVIQGSSFLMAVAQLVGKSTIWSKMLARVGQTLGKRVSDDSRNFTFRRRRFFFETSNGRLPPKHGSDRRETLPKRVSGDPRHFIFRRPQTFLATKISVGKFFCQHPNFFFSKAPVLEELCRFTRLYRMQIENSLPDI